MRKNLLPIVLAASLCLGLLAGCQSSELHSYSEETAAESAAPEETAATTVEKDYTLAYESYDPDEVMLTVNGIDVTWAELFYWYVSDVSSIESYYGAIDDWDADCSFSPGMTYRDYIIESELDTIKHFCVIESKAKDMGVELTEEDNQALQDAWQNNVDSYGGTEEDFISYLNSTYYISKDLYAQLSAVSYLYTDMMNNMFGATGENISADEVDQKANDLGYVRVKHILIKTQDDSGADLPDEQKAEKKAQAENILAELQGITDNAALETRFDELMAENGEDPGMEYYTDGYTFIAGSGTMDTNFDAASAALGEYELSDIVESSFGYHIILRLPLKAENAVYPSQALEDGSEAPLSYVVANQMIGENLENWVEESTISFSDAYENMDIAEVFSKATEVKS